jgi:hypothetical protein
MPDQPNPSRRPQEGIARWGSLPIEQRFREATKNLSHAECMRLLPLVKAWVAQKERQYGAQAAAIPAGARIRIGNKNY